MANKYYNFYISSLTYDNIYNAYLLSKRCKTFRDDIIRFNFKLELYLKDILIKLKNNNYRFSKYNIFYVYEPKERKILAAPFRDRIVHTFLVVYHIEKIFAPTFIHNSYACLKNKGMHRCVKDVKKALYNSKEDYYVLKMDIRKFFDSINRDILFNIIKKKVYDKEFLSIIKVLLDSNKEYDIVDNTGIPIR